MKVSEDWKLKSRLGDAIAQAYADVDRAAKASDTPGRTYLRSETRSVELVRIGVELHCGRTPIRNLRSMTELRV